MITLGLVDSVDDNGVYVTMPGSRGVLRGPYKSLSTVAAGTTVLVASTDDGEQVVVGPVGGADNVYNVREFGAVGDGVTDDSAAVQAAFDAAGAATVVFPAGYVYALASSIVPSPGVTVMGAGATLLNTTKHIPVFDLVQVDDVTIDGLRFTTSATRSYTGGTSVRLHDINALWCGVYISASRVVVTNCSFSGFSVGVHLTTWDASANDASGVTDDCQVTECTFDDVTFGVLAKSCGNLQLRGLSGSYSQDPGTVLYPPHLIYVNVGAGTSVPCTNLLIDRVRASGTDSYAVQTKYVTGGRVTNILADGCPGVLAMTECYNVHVDGVTAINDDTPGTGSLYIFADNSDLTVSNVSIYPVSPTPTAARMARITGGRITATNLNCFTDWDYQCESGEWYIDGADIVVSGVRSVNASDYGAPAVQVDGGCTGCSVSDVSAVNCRSGVRIGSGAGVNVAVDVDRIVNGSSISSPYVVHDLGGTGAVTLTGDTFAHSGSTVGFFGATPAAKPTVTGSRGGNAALASLLTQLATLGLITDSSS